MVAISGTRHPLPSVRSVGPDDPAGVPPWRALGPAPHAPMRARIAEQLFRRAVRNLPVRVALPGGERLGAGGPDSPVMRIEQPAAFFGRLGADAKIGFGESYMAGEWSSSALADLLTPFAERLAVLIPPPLQVLRRWVERQRPAAERNTVSGARRNIERHYDLSNDLFATFLDETMTYSGAWFADTSDLAEAQRRKIDAVLDLAQVGPGTRLLEIGTGWGALALRAARRGADVTSLTVSAQQQRYATRLLADAGVADRARILLRDYRQAPPAADGAGYDAVVSVEMIEAVGLEYWPTYFATVDRMLAPHGRAALQTITMPHDRLLATRDTYTWMHKYVFPGGQLLSVPAVERALGRWTALRVTARRTLGADYARTLRLWRERFLAHADEVERLGFDATFRRMWEFYLAYCEAGFRARYLDVWQFGLARSAD